MGYFPAPRQPPVPSGTLADSSAIATTTATPPSGPVAAYNTGSWSAGAIREHGSVVWDPATSLWVVVWTGQTTGSVETVGLATSTDGKVFTEASNPITPTIEAEDPFLVKTATGELYRDAAGLAYMYVEEKVGGGTGHQGIDLWRSGANVLTGWTRYGRVLDRGASGWDATDRTSPTVIHDGSQFVMLYEGRGTGNDGQVGYATSADGLSFTASATPLVVQAGAGTWSANAVVPDDLIKVGSTWVLLVHGSPDGVTFERIGRYSTTDAPGSWTDSSFTAMTGNPFATDTETLQCWGNDPAFGLAIDRDRRYLYKVAIVEA